MNTKSEKVRSSGYGERLKEITAVLHKHAITRGVSPEKLRMILEDLGPTYIKLGSDYVVEIRYFCRSDTAMN